MLWRSIFRVCRYNVQRGVSTRLPRLATLQGHPELSRLPKAPEIRSLRLRNVSPGAPMNLVYGNTNSAQIDSSHPLARYSRNELHKLIPSFATPIFKLFLYPKALLRPWDNLEYMTKVRQKGVSAELDEALSEARHGRLHSSGEYPGDTRRKKHSLPMSMVIFVPISLHSSALIRNKLKSRIREAVRLVVVRGAHVSEEKSGPIDLAAQEGISRDSPEFQLVLRDWIYVFRPMVELFRYPWRDLIREMRTALEGVRRKGIHLTHQWSSATMSQRSVKKPGGAEQRRAGPSRTPNASPSNNEAKRRYPSSVPNERQPSTPLTRTNPQRLPSAPQQSASPRSNSSKVRLTRKAKHDNPASEKE